MLGKCMGSVCIVLWPGFQPFPIKWLLLGDAWSMSPVAGQATQLWKQGGGGGGGGKECPVMLK